MTEPSGDNVVALQQRLQNSSISSSAAPSAGGKGGKGKASQATVLAGMALARYDIRADPTGTVYALPKDGPHIARPLRGGGGSSLRSELSKLHRRRWGNVPTQSALTDAITSLEGEAADAEPVEMHLRVAEHDGALWLDLADDKGRAVRIDATGWEVVDHPPVWFRRTAVTQPLPMPEQGGSFDPLWELVNVDPDGRVLVQAVEVATLFPNISHPVTYLLAEQGSGKTTAGRMLGGLADPSFPEVRKPPKDDDSWVTAAAGSHVVVIDNLSHIDTWLSDALCRAVTGEGDVRRQLYTDGELHVVAFRRCIWLTGIALSGVRDDLADRLVTLNLRRITSQRRTEAEILAGWEIAHPGVLGALLDLTVRALAALPTVTTDDLPRMADFTHILRAVDVVQGTDGAARYAESVQQTAADLAEADPVAVALTKVVQSPLLRMTSAEVADVFDHYWLHNAPYRTPARWPNTPQRLANALTRVMPTLTRLGWNITKHERGGKEKTLRWSITPPGSYPL
ncbi:MAG: ATP-binding protein [Actinomycetota bacterium]|nr:ATP-binding protein [Actinomycetota bacterium]MDP9459243.1 ATP-binding protein [Actinomycetota bacterium]